MNPDRIKLTRDYQKKFIIKMESYVNGKVKDYADISYKYGSSEKSKVEAIEAVTMNYYPDFVSYKINKNESLKLSANENIYDLEF